LKAAPGFDQVALSDTVVEAKAGWIADPGGCRAMAEEHDLTAPREPAPEAVVRVGVAGQRRDREQAQRHGPGDPFRR
jgi:hypothetical protein